MFIDDVLYDEDRSDKLIKRGFITESILVLFVDAVKYVDPTVEDNPINLIKDILMKESYDKDEAATKFNDLASAHAIYIDCEKVNELCEGARPEVAEIARAIISESDPLETLKFTIYGYISNVHKLESLNEYTRKLSI